MKIQKLVVFIFLQFAIQLCNANDISVKLTNPTNNTCNGKIDLTILGGFPLYDIVWTNNQGVVKDESGITGGDGREDITNLCPNIQYCVSITDAACGVLNYCWTLTECPVITVSAVIIPFPRPSSCAAMDGGLRVLSSSHQGGQAPFNYHIEDQYGNRYTLDNNSYVGNLSSGKYYFVVTDANGCKGSYGIDLIAEDGFHITLSNLQHTCQGSSDGLIEIYSISNDINETFNYHWSNGINHLNIPWADPSLIDHLSAGKYCVTVTSNSTSCELIDCYTIKGNTNTPLSLNSTLEMPCKDTRNGKINLNVTGGTLPYTYVWDPSGTIPGLGLYAGTYCVTVTDFCGASVHQCFELKEVSYELQSGILCKDEGWGEIHVMNGNPPYSITWFVNGIGAIGHGPRIDNLSNGNYLVFGHDAKNCNFNNTFEINYINKNFIEFMHNNSTCNGDADSRDGEIRIGSIDTRNYTFSWTGPFGFTSTSRNISMLRPGNYKVTITDPDGCTEYIEQELCCCIGISTDLPTCQTSAQDISFTSKKVSPKSDELMDGSINLTVTGGTGKYFYKWSGPNNFNSNKEDIIGIGIGIYYVTITDGCIIKTNMYNLLSCSSKDIIINGSVVNTCPNLSLGEISIEVLGQATQPLIYSWSNGSHSMNLIKLSKGNYCVTVTDNDDCSTTKCFVVLDNTDPEEIFTNGDCTSRYYCNNNLFYTNSHIVNCYYDNPSNCREYNCTCTYSGFKYPPVNRDYIDYIADEDCKIYGICPGGDPSKKEYIGQGTKIDKYLGFSDGKCKFEKYCEFNLNGSIIKLSYEKYEKDGTETFIKPIVTCEGTKCKTKIVCDGKEKTEEGCFTCPSFLSQNQDFSNDQFKNIKLVDYLCYISNNLTLNVSKMLLFPDIINDTISVMEYYFLLNFESDINKLVSVEEFFLKNLKYNCLKTNKQTIVNSKTNKITDSFDDDYFELIPRIYPNPTNSIINIEFYTPLKNDLILQLFNALGSQVYYKNLQKGISNTSENLTELNSGIYFLMIKNKSSHILYNQSIIISNHD